jgi:DMSO/TMAO reductase YedYZ molybdopterin-dependent catalytic subunit
MTAMPRRLTNDLLLGLVVALALSGVLGWALAGDVAGPLYDVHRGLGVAVLVVLVAWKAGVIKASLARRIRPGRRWDGSVVWGAIGATGLVAGVALGLAWTLNLITFDTLWGYSPLNIHVFVGLGLLPFVGWHALVRRKANRASAPVASRRAAIRLAGLAAAALAGVIAIPRVAALLSGPGSRRETGSKFAAALSGNAYPAEIWLFDQVPLIDPADWRLRIGERTITLDDLLAMEQREVQAVLDCTGGWWTEQVWRGVPLQTVLPPAAQRVTVTSTTGHRIDFDAADLHQAVLATHVGGEPLSPAHGYPVRLAVPGRRGYQWVKWVAHIDVS